MKRQIPCHVVLTLASLLICSCEKPSTKSQPTISQIQIDSLKPEIFATNCRNWFPGKPDRENEQRFRLDGNFYNSPECFSTRTIQATLKSNEQIVNDKCTEISDERYLVYSNSTSDHDDLIAIPDEVKRFTNLAVKVMDPYNVKSDPHRAIYRLILGARDFIYYRNKWATSDDTIPIFRRRRIVAKNAYPLPVRMLKIEKSGDTTHVIYKEYWVQKHRLIVVFDEIVSPQWLAKFDSIIEFSAGGIYMGNWIDRNPCEDFSCNEPRRGISRIKDTSNLLPEKDSASMRFYNLSGISEYYKNGTYHLSYGMVGVRESCNPVQGGLASVLPGIKPLLNPYLQKAILACNKNGSTFDPQIISFWESDNFWLYNAEYQRPTWDMCFT